MTIYNANIITIITRLLQASEAESLGELHVHPQPGGEDPLHLQCDRSDHRLWTSCHR